MAMPLGRRKPTLLEDLMLLRILWYFSSFLFSSISAVAESEQGMRPVA